MSAPSVSGAIRDALLTGEASAKVFAARTVARDWRLGRLDWRFDCAMPESPAWPATLQLAAPGRMPKTAIRSGPVYTTAQNAAGLRASTGTT